ncbi:MAG: hypothetical protein AB9891_20720 [Anaerolineaceae bacterium]
MKEKSQFGSGPKDNNFTFEKSSGGGGVGDEVAVGSTVAVDVNEIVGEGWSVFDGLLVGETLTVGDSRIGVTEGSVFFPPEQEESII